MACNEILSFASCLGAPLFRGKIALMVVTGGESAPPCPPGWRGLRLNRALLVAVMRLNVGAMMLLVLLSSAVSAGSSEPAILHESYPAGARYMGIRLLGTVEVIQTRVDDLPLVELSALAWDDDRALLYAVSDNGYLYHLEPRIEAGRLVAVEAVAGFRLRGTDGKPLTGKYADAEGMTLRFGGDGDVDTAELLVSFERRPRVLRFSPDGRQLGEVSIPADLRRRSIYTTENKALEGIAEHPRWGLLGAPEWPLRAAQDLKHYPIVQLDSGKQWMYPRFPAPKAGLVAMEVLDDGGLLTLERAYVSVWRPMYIVLRRSEPLPQPYSDPWVNPPLESHVVAELSSAQGWIIDNFEGLTRYRGQRFFMVSDNNRKALQRTLLVMFELLDDQP